MPEQPMDVWRLYEEFYSIPSAAILGLLLGMIVGAIYVSTRSLGFLAVGGIYVIALTASTFVADAYLEPQFRSAVYIIIFAISTGVLIFVLKTLRE